MLISSSSSSLPSSSESSEFQYSGPPSHQPSQLTQHPIYAITRGEDASGAGVGAFLNHPSCHHPNPSCHQPNPATQLSQSIDAQYAQILQFVEQTQLVQAQHPINGVITEKAPSTEEEEEEEETSSEEEEEEEGTEEEYLPSKFKSFYEDDLNISPSEKILFLLGVCVTGIVDVTMEDIVKPPYTSMLKSIKPSRKLLMEEVKRRNPTKKGLKNMSIKKLIKFLKETNSKLTLSDIDFIQQEFKRVRDMLMQLQKKKDENTKMETLGGNISLIDCLRYVEIMLSDDVKALYLESQNSLTREELDYRNSVHASTTFHIKMVDLFNNPEVVPKSLVLPELHFHFNRVMKLPLTTYKLTVGKAKDILKNVKPQLFKVVSRYERSGEGGGSRDDSHEDWGTFDINKCSEGDDRGRFIAQPSQSFLLYWWHVLDIEGLIQFTCVRLPTWMTATLENFTPIDRGNKRKVTPGSKTKQALEQQVGKIGYGVNNIAYMSIAKEIHDTKRIKLEYELKEIDFDSEDECNQKKKKLYLYQKYISDLQDSIAVLENKEKSME